MQLQVFQSLYVPKIMKAGC